MTPELSPGQPCARQKLSPLVLFKGRRGGPGIESNSIYLARTFSWKHGDSTRLAGKGAVRKSFALGQSDPGAADQHLELPGHSGGSPWHANVLGHGG